MIKPLSKYLNIAHCLLSSYVNYNNPVCFWCGKEMRTWLNNPNNNPNMISQSMFNCVHNENGSRIVYRVGSSWQTIRINEDFLYGNFPHYTYYHGDFDNEIMKLILTDQQLTKQYISALFERISKLMAFQ